MSEPNTKFNYIEKETYFKNIIMNPLLKSIYLKNKHVIPRELPNNPELPFAKPLKNIEAPNPSRKLFMIKRKKSSVSPYNIFI